MMNEQRLGNFVHNDKMIMRSAHEDMRQGVDAADGNDSNTSRLETTVVRFPALTALWGGCVIECVNASSFGDEDKHAQLHRQTSVPLHVRRVQQRILFTSYCAFCCVSEGLAGLDDWPQSWHYCLWQRPGKIPIAMKNLLLQTQILTKLNSSIVAPVRHVDPHGVSDNGGLNDEALYHSLGTPSHGFAVSVSSEVQLTLKDIDLSSGGNVLNARSTFTSSLSPRSSRHEHNTALPLAFLQVFFLPPALLT